MLALNHPQLPPPEPVAIRKIAAVAPTPQLNLHPEGDDPLATYLNLDFIYNDTIIDTAVTEAVVTIEQRDELVQLYRGLPSEKSAIEQLSAERLVQNIDRPNLFELPDSSEP
jgi:hypothetical protein